MSTGAVVPQAGETPDMRARTILVERARSLARPARVEKRGALVSLVLFTIGGVQHAFEANFVREVLRRPLLSLVPFAPAPLLGVANVRGEILTVADISGFLDLAPPPIPGPVIVLTGPGPSLGVLVEGVRDFVDVAADSILALPGEPETAGAKSDLVTGVISESAVLSAATLLDDPRLSTTEPRSGR